MKRIFLLSALQNSSSVAVIEVNNASPKKFALGMPQIVSATTSLHRTNCLKAAGEMGRSTVLL